MRVGLALSGITWRICKTAQSVYRIAVWLVVLTGYVSGESRISTGDSAYGMTAWGVGRRVAHEALQHST